MQSWILLFTAIFFEVSGTLSMKFSDGFSRLIPSVLIFIFYGCSFFALTMALKKRVITYMPSLKAYAMTKGVPHVIAAERPKGVK